MFDETNTHEDQEYLEALMLDALDGNLSKSGERELNKYLENNPALAEELKGMMAVETLFADVGLVEPPKEFVAETIAQLPNLSVRKWATGFVGALVIILGILPIALITFLFSNMPAQEAILALTESVISSLAQVVLSLFGFVQNQPIALGIPAIMIGSIFLWTITYRRMVGNLIPARG
ncbi:MAG: hypothetical protein AAGD96_36200 [Chloroflexota bacterium]